MAIKMNEPIGNTAYGPLLVRLPLGVYFLQAGLLEIQKHGAVLQLVKEISKIPAPLVPLYGTLIPYMEVVAGVLLILGTWASGTTMPVHGIRCRLSGPSSC